jgi:uncharacterized membrane protein YhaH (DUF805 family)
MNNNWLWKDLYVWPQGKLSRAAYLGALLRIVIIYVLFVQVLSVFSPTLLTTFKSGEPADTFLGIKWGQIGAIIFIAFPVWSLFQRRVNDMRPDIREKLNTWSVAFPLILAGLVGLMVANAVGFATPLDSADLSNIRFWFAVMLFGSAFVPGGEHVPAKNLKKIRSEAQQNLISTLAQMPKEVDPTTRTQPHPVARHQPIPANPLPGMQVAQRQYKMPEQGRVKPGWFS